MEKDLDLDALFAEAAELRAEPPAALTARILSDAAREQPKPQVFVRKEVSPQSGRVFGWFGGLSDVLGGVRGMAGLSLAGLTGIYLGVAQPAGLADVASLLTGATATVDAMDLLPASSTLWAEN